MPVLRKRLSDDLWLIRTRHYPTQHPAESKRGRHQAVLGIGGNIGDLLRRFEHLYNFLVKSPYVTVIETSAILRNPPFGYLAQADFYNAVIVVKSSMTPMALLAYILRVEQRFGRKRSFANAPRTLDIDMIFYDTRTIDSTRLKLPHPYWRERSSVVIPLQTMKGKRWSKRHLLRLPPERHLSWPKRSMDSSAN